MLLLLCKLKRLRLLSYLRRVLCREVRPLDIRVSSPSNTMVEPTPPVQTGSMRILHSQREPNGVPQRLTMMVFTSTASAIMGSVRPHLPALQHRYVFYFSLHKATTTSLSPPPFLLYTHILFLSFFYFAFNKLIRSSNFFMTYREQWYTEDNNDNVNIWNVRLLVSWSYLRKGSEPKEAKF